MAAQLLISARNIDAATAREHLPKKKYRRFLRDGHVVIDGPADKHRRTKLQRTLKAVLVS